MKKIKSGLVTLLIISLIVILVIKVFPLNKSVNNQDDGNAKESTERFESDATFPEYSYSNIIEESDYIIEGRPIEISKSYFENEDIPFTEFRFEITNSLKGNLKGSKVLVLQDGLEGEEFSNHPLMKLDATYILYLKRSTTNDLIIVGGPNGKFDKIKESIFENELGIKINENLEIIK